jgi:hypothetical protein
MKKPLILQILVGKKGGFGGFGLVVLVICPEKNFKP